MREVIEIEREPVIGDRVDHVGIGPDQPLVGVVLVEEWRQHEEAGDTQAQGMLGQGDGVGSGATADAHDHAFGLEPGGDEGFETLLALGDRIAIGFAGGSENAEPVAALAQ